MPLEREAKILPLPGSSWGQKLLKAVSSSSEKRKHPTSAPWASTDPHLHLWDSPWLIQDLQQLLFQTNITVSSKPTHYMISIYVLTAANSETSPTTSLNTVVMGVWSEAATSLKHWLLKVWMKHSVHSKCQQLGHSRDSPTEMVIKMTEAYSPGSGWWLHLPGAGSNDQETDTGSSPAGLKNLFET